MSRLNLPIDAQLPDIVRAVREAATVVLTATPGAGKTTRIPPALLSAVPGKIAVLQPRRLAAIAACQRVAQENGWTVGREVGYQVRFESKLTEQTRLIFMTDALMLRRWIDDLEMRSFDMVVLDEFHERNLNQDLLLGAIRELQQLGSPLKLLVMSATLDTQVLRRFLGDPVVVDVPGKVFPLTLQHSTQPLQLRTDFAFVERVASAVQTAARQTAGDVLVFLPGVGEIARITEKLEAMRIDRQILPLHGSLSLALQSRALRLPEPGQARVILATNVAEASVTVQGVDFVIDTGLARTINVNLTSGFSTLELGRIALFNARQRAGRAAREKAGVCWRLWTEHEEVTQAEQMTPECMRSDLASSLLLLAHSGVRDFAGFSWLDRPPGRLLDLAIASLRGLRALDPENRLTEFGARLLRFPLPPRLASMLLWAEDQGLGKMAARVCAILNEKDFVRGLITTPYECDIVLRLHLLQEIERGLQPSSVHRTGAQSVLETSMQLERLIKIQPDERALDEAGLRRLLLKTHADRLCRKRGAGALMVGGRGVKLDETSQVRSREFFVALNGMDLPMQSDTRVTLACGVSKSELLEVLGDQVVTEERVEFVEAKEAFFLSRVRSILRLPIDEPSLTPVKPEEVAGALSELLFARWDWLIEKNEALGSWMARHRFLLKLKPELALSQEQITETLQMAAFGKTKIREVLESDILGMLKMNLPAELVKVVDVEAPDRFKAPTGHSHRIHYADHGAYVEVRLQELFGLNATPQLGFGQKPLAFHLLGPNYRPVQVTSDLAGFWKGAYREVRKELRARYPKHAWPEDPLSAAPEAKGRRRES